MSSIVNQIEEMYGELVDIREHLHMHPELSFEEFQTSQFIQNKLKAFGIHDFKVVCQTGIVGHIGPKEEVIAVRADIDALPILEANQVSYKSKNEGVMHACGHDVHTTCLLGVLKLLKQKEKDLKKGVRFIFQPGEEKLPGGASLLIKEGVLKNPVPELIIGQHVYPELAAGKVGYRPGTYMASCDEIYIDFIGKGGHGALPQNNVDPIMMSAQFLTGVQQVVSRKADPKIPTVLSFGHIEGLGATNVIPDKVSLQGTFRTFNEQWREQAHQHITEFANATAQMMGGKAIVDIRKGYPFLNNDEVGTEKCKTISENVLGKKNVVDLDLRMTAEDFSYYSQEIPSVFYRLGTGNAEMGIIASVHSPKFDIDPNALKTGVLNMYSLVMEWAS